MFLRRVRVERVGAGGEVSPVSLKAIDSFAMRNFTNDAIFDDTLPLADGLMELGLRVPLPLLQERMADWLRRKGHLVADDKLRLCEEPALP